MANPKIAETAAKAHWFDRKGTRIEQVPHTAIQAMNKKISEKLRLSKKSVSCHAIYQAVTFSLDNLVLVDLDFLLKI